MLRFGISLKPLGPASSLVRLAQLAEMNSFSHVWVSDSPVLWQDVYTVLSLIADRTTRIRFGPYVTNPAIRDVTVTASAMATLQEISGGRADCGLGRGDSSLRLLGRSPTTIADLESTIRTLRLLCAGKPSAHADAGQLQLKWTTGPPPPIWLAAQGPRALRLGGALADGVIVAPADPEVIDWSLGFVREGAREAGRRFEDIQIICSTAACISDDIARARDQVRWSPAVKSNHIIDLVERYGSASLPKVFTENVASRRNYKYEEHARKDASHNRFVTDDVIDKFCVIGPPDACAARFRELEAAGVHQFVAQCADWEDAEALITAVGTHFVPSG